MIFYNLKVYERDVVTDIKVDTLAETLKLDESLDTAALTIPRATRKKQFRRFSKVAIKITEDDYSEERFYLIYLTKSELESKGNYPTYLHTLSLIEPIKWLEKFQVGTLTFRQPLDPNKPKKTLKDYVDRVLNLTPFVSYEKLGSTRVVSLDTDFANDLEKVIAPQLDLEKKNLRECLIEIFKVVNAIPRMYYDNDSGTWYVKGDYINQRKLPFEIGNDIIDYKEELSGENFAQAAEIFHENTIPDDDNGIIYEGSINEYIHYRSEQIVVGGDTINFILSQNVAEIKKVYMISTASDGTLKTAKQDITSYIYNKDVYDTLPFDSGKGSQSHSLYWVYKKNVIGGLNRGFNAIFQRYAVENVIRDKENHSGQADLFPETIFQIEYVPYFETMRSIQYREDKDPYIIEDDLFDKYSSIQINQQERLNFLYDLTDNIYGQIQRTGVETVMFSKKHYTIKPYHPSTNPNGIYQEGDYTSDGYYVTKVERVYGRTHVVGRYELSKNWNRISQFVKVDQEFRPYEISMLKTNNALKRDILFNIGFVEVSLEEFNDLTNISNLKTRFMETFKPSVYQGRINAMRLQSPTFSDYYVTKPLAPLAEKNTLKWKVDMPDTKNAGNKFRDSKQLVGEFANLVSQVAVPYTDSYGELERVRIQLFDTLVEYFNDDLLVAPTTLTSLRILGKEFPSIKKDASYLVEGSDGKIFIEDYQNQSNFSYKRKLYKVPTFADRPLNLADLVALSSLFDTDEPYFLLMTEEPQSLFYECFYNISTDTVTGYDTSNVVIGKLKNPLYSLPYYNIYKDSGEVLGFEITLPVLPDSRYFNTFVIGQYLLKENGLVYNREIEKTKYFVGLNKRIEKTNAKKINLIGGETLYEIEPFIAEAIVQENYIDVPAVIYDNFDYYAIIDIDGNLFLGVNQTDLNGVKTDVDRIYFNFRENRYLVDFVKETAAQSIFDFKVNINTVAIVQENYATEANIGMRIGLTTQTLQFEYIHVTTQAFFGFEIGITTQVSLGVKSWELIGSQSAPFAEYDYDVGVAPNPTNSPNVNVDNYEVGDLVMCNDGALPTNYYLYEVKNAFI